MNQEIITQLQFFMVSILWGALILIAYDQLRILRRLIRHNTFFVAIQDLIFWVLASVFIFAMIYVKNSGIIRGFSVMGMVIGMLIYHYIISDWIVMLISRVIFLLLRPFSIAVKYILKGIKILINKAKILMARIYGQLKKRVKSVKISISGRRQKRKAEAAAKKHQRKEKVKKNKKKRKKASQNNDKR